MAMVNITFKDGSVKGYPRGTTVLEIANDISRGLAKNAVAAKLNEKKVDLQAPVDEDSVLEILAFDSKEGQDVYRHSTSHIMAQAVKHLFPGVKFGIGPAISDGFYYDFDMPVKLTPEDLPRIEAEMERIIKQDYPFERFEVSREEALKIFKKAKEKYKVELINDLPEDTVISCYRQGDFVDLCAGPHVPSTGKIKSVKLMSLAGAYWRGDERNKMLQRIYGTSFPKKTMLDEYIFRIEEAKKRDHRKIGAELDLFSVHDEGPGFPFFHPKGMVLRNELENFWREEHKRAGYQEIRTPMILHTSLWEQSGHWEHYQEHMYFTKIDDDDFAVKPMNCPGSILIYKSKLHSYRDLPVRLAELGLVHRHELSGTLHGLMRVRCFTQDDAHIFMLPAQITGEIIKVIDLIDRFYKVFGFAYHVELSTKPEKAMGSDEVWDIAIESLKKAIETRGMAYKINEGDGAFYGPKIDFHLTDCLGRTWQCGTIQLDFLMPERFDLFYIGEDGQKHRPVMIHRVVFGSIERFIGILVEHFAGAFPVWLSPVQVKILTVTDRGHEYAGEILQAMEQNGIRTEVDWRNEKIGYKIREAQLEKVPYMLIIGDREVENNIVSVRKRGEGEKGGTGFNEFIAEVKEDINLKR